MENKKLPKKKVNKTLSQLEKILKSANKEENLYYSLFDIEFKNSGLNKSELKELSKLVTHFNCTNTSFGIEFELKVVKSKDKFIIKPHNILTKLNKCKTLTDIIVHQKIKTGEICNTVIFPKNKLEFNEHYLINTLDINYNEKIECIPVIFYPTDNTVEKKL